ncbi:MAG: SpoIIIAH-like family protein [Firmicutes bacterium]|nr:SpoIIIAH-like family protein [Bacillota bacterium]MBR0104373.1 SpoIIIAH-like family protein [Bacillota bacterium]
MFILKRNQVIITALVVMIAVAGYLNFSDSARSEKTAKILTDDGTIENAVVYDTIPDDEVFDTATAEDNELESELANIGIDGTMTDEADTTGAAVLVNGSYDNTYFVQAKLEREQARATEKEMLTEIINNANVDSDKKNECTDSIMELQQRIEKETAAEAMIESKGFKDAYVRIDDDTVDVVVNKKDLTEAELAQIEDIVKRKTGISEDKIRISAIKS